jgi:hypothetical protein
VFLETPITLAIARIGIPSARRSRRISLASTRVVYEGVEQSGVPQR